MYSKLPETAKQCSRDQRCKVQVIHWARQKYVGIFSIIFYKTTINHSKSIFLSKTTLLHGLLYLKDMK